MKNNLKPFFIGKNTIHLPQSEVTGNFCELDGETFYKISSVDQMPPFFMSIVSHSDHWMFMSSNGALTAGRKNADFSLFPYYTDDKITESAETAGCKSIFHVTKQHNTCLWEPFSERYEGIYNIQRHLYKNIYGNKIIFEEVNLDLEVSFRYEWNSSNAFGFVRKSTFTNHAANGVQVSLLDGIQNIMPCGVPGDLQNSTSNLVDAYKRSELVKEAGLGIYALSAIISDKAEPSEALKANIVWSAGLENPQYLLSSIQLKNFRFNSSIAEETDIKGGKGAYFVHSDIILPPNAAKKWIIAADVNQNHAAVFRLAEQIKTNPKMTGLLQQDIDKGTQQLVELVASADGLQLTADRMKNTRHFSNTLFNIMRGGVFDRNYQIGKADFIACLSKANRQVFPAHSQLLERLPAEFDLKNLDATASQSTDPDFKRLCAEYLPLMFSRRHGDPSRPWNRFSINTRNETDGSKVLDYQGNWRDIFQNWEALAVSFPSFLEGMIHKFLNASTFDGYNPYRVTKSGFDWETVEPDNPWSYIGYWGDHQVIYLLKLLELLEKRQQGRLESFFDRDIFVYADVPYKIKPYGEILQNPKDTICFDRASDRSIRKKREDIGADGTLLTDRDGQIYHVNFIEKILATVLAKMANFIPEGGIWMNTQRPEWNDANNALVGNGISMVTLYYLRRFMSFFQKIFAASQAGGFPVSEELAVCFHSMLQTLQTNRECLTHSITDAGRKQILDGLANPASDYRTRIYTDAFSGKKVNIALGELREFVDISCHYLEHSIRANRRDDNLYHAYNLMTLRGGTEISITRLSEMLEGQVAILSSGYLSTEEALQLLDSLRHSPLYRKDQQSYILYPNKELPQFTEKNNIPATLVAKSERLQKLAEGGNTRIIEKDINGVYHFNGNFKNANDLDTVIAELVGCGALQEKDRSIILEIFEDCFNHKAFTGRSGTFYAYEGLGSIYWHMVSKLQLAVQEYCVKAAFGNESEEVKNKLSACYHEISEGIGVHKQPTSYGAFPFDPYSHTPAGKGVKQPGMTGQVKEDILSRFGELGVFVTEGKIRFNPFLLKKEEFVEVAQSFDYTDIHLKNKQVSLPENSLGFTYCQVPVVYRFGSDEGITVAFTDGRERKISGLTLDESISRRIFERSGEVESIRVYIKNPQPANI